MFLFYKPVSNLRFIAAAHDVNMVGRWALGREATKGIDLTRCGVVTNGFQWS